MKKIIKAITLFLIIAIFSEVSYAAEYLNSVEFNEKYMNNNVMWAAKNGLRIHTHRKISQDGTDFTEVEGNEEIPNIMKFGQFGYKGMFGPGVIIWFIRRIMVILMLMT